MNNLTPEKITRNKLIREIKARTNMPAWKLAEDFKLSEPRISVILRNIEVQSLRVRSTKKKHKKYSGSLRYTKKRMKPKLLKVINELRKESGLPELKYKERECLSCDKKFDSQGDHNRLCWLCRKANKDEGACEDF